MSEQEMKNSDNQLTGNLPAADGTETVPEKAGKKGRAGKNHGSGRCWESVFSLRY